MRSQAIPAAALRAALVGFSGVRWRSDRFERELLVLGLDAGFDGLRQLVLQLVEGLAEHGGERLGGERPAWRSRAQACQAERVAERRDRGLVAGGVEVLAGGGCVAVEDRGGV